MNLDAMSNHEAEVDQQEQMPNQEAEAQSLPEIQGRDGLVVHTGAHTGILQVM